MYWKNLINFSYFDNCPEFEMFTNYNCSLDEIISQFDHENQIICEVEVYYG